MFVDASALTAMLLAEPEARSLLERVAATDVRLTSPMAVWETTVAVARERGFSVSKATDDVGAFLQEIGIISQAGQSRDCYTRPSSL